MGVFENLYVKFRAVFGVVSDKASQIVDISKLKIKIAEYENRKKHEFEKLGRLIYHDKKENVLDNSEIESRVAEIDELNDKIGVLKSEISDMKDKTTCEKKSCTCSHCDRHSSEKNNVLTDNDNGDHSADDSPEDV